MQLVCLHVSTAEPSDVLLLCSASLGLVRASNQVLNERRGREARAEAEEQSRIQDEDEAWAKVALLSF